MRLGPSRERSRWLLGGAVLVPAVLFVVLAVGLPGERGCGGAGLEELDRAQPCGLTVAAVRPPSQQPSRVVFLNRAGVTLKAGADDAANDVSSVLTRRGLEQLTIPAAPFNEAEWRSVVACVQQRFSAFDLEVVTERPAGGAYSMAVFGGTGAELGFANDIGGTAPIDSACATVDRAVAFIFSQRLGADPQLHCEVAAQEIAHAFSVDHSFVAGDAMSYLPSSTAKTFLDSDAACGEFQARACVCGRASQNSYRLLLERLGPASRRPDLTPPTLQVSLDRSRGDSVVVSAKPGDDRAVAQVRLTVRSGEGDRSSLCGDNQIPCIPGANETRFSVSGVRDGSKFQVTALDGAGNLMTTTSSLTPEGTQVAIELRSQVAASGRRTVWASVRPLAGSRVLTLAAALWTQPDGTMTRYPMCAREDGSWSVPIELSSMPGKRGISVEVVDTSGSMLLSAPEALAFSP